jgi:hypothetical protein
MVSVPANAVARGVYAASALAKFGAFMRSRRGQRVDRVFRGQILFLGEDLGAPAPLDRRIKFDKICGRKLNAR